MRYASGFEIECAPARWNEPDKEVGDEQASSDAREEGRQEREQDEEVPALTEDLQHWAVVAGYEEAVNTENKLKRQPVADEDTDDYGGDEEQVPRALASRGPAEGVLEAGEAHCFPHG
jgi:hypothetical protein